MANVQKELFDNTTDQEIPEASTILINHNLFSSYYLGSLFDSEVRARQGDTGTRMPLSVRNRLQARWDKYIPTLGSTSSYGRTHEAWLETLFQALGYEPLDATAAKLFKEDVLPEGYMLYHPIPAQAHIALNAPIQQARTLLVAEEISTYETSADDGEDTTDELVNEDEEKQTHDVLISLLSWGTDFDRPFAIRVRRNEMPHKLLERLLASGGPARWGILCNGRRIRLLRRDVVAGRQQYYEVDLEALFDNRNEHDADTKERGFNTFWALFRAQSFQPGADGLCLLDIVDRESRKHAEGVSARLKISVFRAIDTVMKALVNRASELCTLPVTLEDSPEQRRRVLAERALKDLPGLYKQSLVFLYRLLFVFYAESRTLLPIDNAVYRQSYSLHPLREEIELPDAEKRYQPDTFRLWETLQALFRLIHWGCNTTQMVVPAYNGNLFDPHSASFLNAIRLPDSALYDVLYQLSVTPPTKNRGRERIDYRDLGVEQLGSVYEGLLEFEPRVATEPMIEVSYKGTHVVIPERNKRDYKPERTIQSGEFYLGRGAGRKTSGSYYTPQALVDFLVRRTLEPLVQGKKAEEILALKIVDPAMGSGAFLVGACLYLADAYARALRREEVLLAGKQEDSSLATASATDEITQPTDAQTTASSTDSDTVSESEEEEELSEEATRPYRRLIAEHCLYGVDLNEMAVELAKVSLWLTTLAGDKPLTFLDANLRWGNSLISAPLHVAGHGQDIYTIYTIHKKANERLARERGDTLSARSNKSKERTLFDNEQVEPHTISDELDDVKNTVPSLVDHRSWIATQPSDTVAQVHDKANVFRQYVVEDSKRAMLEEICNLWVATWFWKQPHKLMLPTEPGWIPALDEQIYTELVTYIRKNYYEDVTRFTNIDPGPYMTVVNKIVQDVNPFHWELEFPEVYFELDGRPRTNPGFDAVLGNPPWDTVKPNSREFFAAYDPGFRDLERVEADLRQEDLLEEEGISNEWDTYVNDLEGQSEYFRQSSVYLYQSIKIDGKLTGGDPNTYKFFMERANYLLANHGKAAQIVKADVYKGQGSTGLRQLLLYKSSCDFLYALSNEKWIFPSVHHAERFALVGFTKAEANSLVHTSFAITTREAISPNSLSTYLTDPNSIMHVPSTLIKKMSPDTLSIMEFRSQQDVDITAKIYSNWPLLGETIPGMWSINLAREFDMTNHRWLFNTEGMGWFLYEGKMIHQYTHSFSEPQYWVEPEKGQKELARKEIQRVEEALDKIALDLKRTRNVLTRKARVERLLKANGRGPLTANDVLTDAEGPRLAFRDVAASTNERAMITAILPKQIFTGNTLNYVKPWRFNAREAVHRLNDIKSCYEPALPALVLAYLCGVFNSFTLDYVLRFKITNHVNQFYAYQLPIPRLTSDDAHCQAIAQRVARLVCVGPEFDDLRCELLGNVNAHVATLQQERQRLQNEVDALVAHLYGLKDDDLQHILYTPYTFPLVKREIKDNVMAAFERVDRLLAGER